ncbi:MAG: zinc-binding dehydrogenase [Armatimonadetes bacterium]|nr:zinc-binding dehydrogenase [Armatimonadota bacterium]
MLTTRYVRVDEPCAVRLAEEAIDPPGEHEVLLAARRSLISTGSELRRYRRYEGYDAFTYPVTDLGYSFAGTLVAAGRAVRAQAGDRYAAVARHASLVTMAANADEVRTALPIPAGVSDEEATFGPLLRSTLNWLRVAAVTPGHTVAVLGQGLVGALLLQAVKLRQVARVFVTDTYPLRLDIARACGADEAIHAGETDPVQAVRALTGGRGADVVIDTVGGAFTDSFGQALGLCRSGGRIVMVGMHTRPLALPVHTIHDKTRVGSNVGYDTSARIFARGLAMIEAGSFRPGALITHRFAIDDVAAAYQLLDQRPEEALGVILEWPEA